MMMIFNFIKRLHFPPFFGGGWINTTQRAAFFRTTLQDTGLFCLRMLSLEPVTR